MFSLQTIFGKGDKFYSLLESSADAARLSARALRTMLADGARTPALDQFRVARKREKDLFAQINLELVNTFVTALEREDIEALAGALYKIPKTVEKFAERHALFVERLSDIDYSPQAAMLERACDVIVSMVGELRGGIKLDVMHALNERMQSIESEADRLLLELYNNVFTDETDAARLMVRKDLYELLEKAIDRCRDAGNVIYHIALKNS